MRVRLDIAYDGTDFRGWAIQPGLRTVQGVLQSAIERIVGGTVRLVVAGRTDSGVHAEGQVAHVDLDPHQLARLTHRRFAPGEDAIEVLARRITAVLGEYSDVHVVTTSTAPRGFDARFSAVWRRYRYRLSDAISDYDPLTRANTAHAKVALDVEAMNEAAASLIGLHDFAAYCKPRDDATTIRTLFEYEWHRDQTGVLIAHLKADAFCHSMVRALVGVCVGVGEGRLAPSDAAALRDARERTSAFTVLAARGLTLAEVRYPTNELLAQRAEQTRARRKIDPITTR